MQYITEMAKRITNDFPARLRQKQKQAFRQFLLQELTELGWQAEVVVGGRLVKPHNVVTESSDPDVILMAHYDTAPHAMLSGPVRLFGNNSWQALFVVVLTLRIIVDTLVRILGSLFSQGFTHPDDFISHMLIPALMISLYYSFGFPNPSNHNDNTSGVLALLEIARRLKTNPELKNRVQLVFCDLEEFGLIGSRQLRAHWRSLGVNLQGKTIINFDCIGTGRLPYVCHSGQQACAEALFEHLRQTRPDTRLINRSFSDHHSFRSEGAVSILFATPAVFGSGCYLPHIHTTKDCCLESANIAWVTEEVIGLCDRRMAAPQVG